MTILLKVYLQNSHFIVYINIHRIWAFSLRWERKTLFIYQIMPKFWFSNSMTNCQKKTYKCSSSSFSQKSWHDDYYTRRDLGYAPFNGYEHYYFFWRDDVFLFRLVIPLISIWMDSAVTHSTLFCQTRLTIRLDLQSDHLINRRHYHNAVDCCRKFSFLRHCYILYKLKLHSSSVRSSDCLSVCLV